MNLFNEKNLNMEDKKVQKTYISFIKRERERERETYKCVAKTGKSGKILQLFKIIR